MPISSLGSPGGVAVEWVSLHPSQRFLYAFTCFWDKASGEAKSYEVDISTGLLQECAAPSCPTGGNQPCHADFDPDGKWLAVAHYLGGVVSILDCSAGALGAKPVCSVDLPGDRPKPGATGRDIPCQTAMGRVRQWLYRTVSGRPGPQNSHFY